MVFGVGCSLLASASLLMLHRAGLDGLLPAAQADAQQSPKKRRPFYVGPDVGVFLPTSAKTRGRFGPSWFDFGGSLGRVSGYSRGHFDLDLHLLGHGQNSDAVLFGLIGADYRHPLLQGWNQHHSEGEKPKIPYLFPYVGVSADLMIANLQSLEDNVDVRYRAGLAGSAFLGLNLGDRAYLEARYFKTSNIEGFELSGVQFSVGYRFAF